ncbi:hypothetical protein DFH29DRAFT_878140 [Suillus ampliporus]|nr:hypothetical protein DFH29DRAFT_878140 [Suillus ampliporus]
MFSGIYKLKSAARPTQYLSLVDNRIVGHSDKGVMNEWLVTFAENRRGMFQPVRNGVVYPEFICFNPESQSLMMSGNPMLFPVRECTGPSESSELDTGPSKSSEAGLFAIEINDTDQVWALLSWTDNTPIVIETDNCSTPQLWVFDKV